MGESGRKLGGGCGKAGVDLSAQNSKRTRERGWGERETTGAR